MRMMPSDSKESLKRRIHQYDFALIDLNLFLDMHPNCQRAIDTFNEYKEKRAELVRLYEQQFGKFVTTAKNMHPDNRWEWINSPWPWENEGACE